jgi:hypothetical protein
MDESFLQRDFDRVVHRHHLGCWHDRGPIVREALQAGLLADEQQARVGMVVEELAARGERNAGAVVAPHAVNSQCDGHRRILKRQRPALRT